MNIGVRWLAAGILAVAGLAVPATAQPAKGQPTAINPEITRRGEGARRNDLTAMELKPFTADLWAKLSDWQNGPALAASDTKGKVVLVVTYASWNRNSAKVVESARKLAETYAKKDLIVVAAHDKDGWKDAEKAKAPEGAKFLLAQDAKNEFRKGLLANQDPEIYLIDRAGQLRFAVIAADAMEAAVKKLTDESADDAGKVNQKLADERARAEAERRRTIGASQHIDMTRFPELAFAPPSDADYESARWPLPPMTETQFNDWKRDGKLPTPLTVELPAEGWVPSAPKSKGRAAVILFFHPDWGNAAKLTQAFDAISDFQRAYGRDIVVTMAVSNIFDERDHIKVAETDPDKMKARIKEFVKGRQIEFSFILDLDNALYDAARGGGNSGEEYKGVLLAVTSTDSKVRFLADPSHWGELDTFLDRIVQVDPGIRARREAERKWLEANKPKTDKPADKPAEKK